MTPLRKQDACSILEGFRERDVSPRDVLFETVERIDGFQLTINAYSFQNQDVEKNAIIIKDNMADEACPQAEGTQSRQHTWSRPMNSR